MRYILSSSASALCMDAFSNLSGSIFARRPLLRNLFFCLQLPNSCAVGGAKIICLIVSVELKFTVKLHEKRSLVPVGERHRQGLGSVSDHRTYHTLLRNTRKQRDLRYSKSMRSGIKWPKITKNDWKKFAGLVRVHEAVGSNPATRSKNPPFSNENSGFFRTKLFRIQAVVKAH